jgi:hypothetical protein
MALTEYVIIISRCRLPLNCDDYMGAHTICQEGHGTAVEGHSGAVPHAHQVKKAKGALPISRGGLEGPLPLQKTPSSALSLPCEIVSISQGRPLLAPEFTTSGQEEAGKGLKIPVCGGSSLHATPFRQEAAVHWMPMGFPGGAPPPSLPRSAGEGSLQASPLARKLLHDKSCVHRGE